MSELEYAECSVCGAGSEVSRLWFDSEHEDIEPYYLTLCQKCKPRINTHTTPKAQIAGLMKYVKHQNDGELMCESYKHSDFSCNCGLDTLLAICKED